ncbi:MAG: hypothetical protein PWQ59_2150 [Thermoanaerobacterium sp.]|nr:hypothetical protein [Thermoanaerobacterium sp.]
MVSNLIFDTKHAYIWLVLQVYFVMGIKKYYLILNLHSGANIDAIPRFDNIRKCGTIKIDCLNKQY